MFLLSSTKFLTKHFAFLIVINTTIIFTKNKLKIMAIVTGQKAPAFTLYDSSKNKISLGDFAGKKNVLLLFFPQAFTSVCTKELCSVRDDIGRYENEQVQVLGISVSTVSRALQDNPRISLKTREKVWQIVHLLYLQFLLLLFARL